MKAPKYDISGARFEPWRGPLFWALMAIAFGPVTKETLKEILNDRD